MKRVEVMDWCDEVDGWYDGLNDAHNNKLPAFSVYEYLEVITEENYES
jgi:hypothetical protein